MPRVECSLFLVVGSVALSLAGAWIPPIARGLNRGCVQSLAMQQSAKTASSPEAAAAIAQARRRDLGIEENKLRREVVEYSHGDLPLQAMAVWPRDGTSLPTVLVVHTAVGLQEDFMFWKLDKLASQGYLAFGVDMFGAGRALWDKEEALAARKPLREDRSQMIERMMCAYETACSMEVADSARVGAIGYCFGGMAVLDLARSGLPKSLKATVSLHGILDRLDTPPTDVVGKVLVCHGGSDPFVTPEMLRDFESDMAARNAEDLHIHTYSGSKHAFTRPEKTTEGDSAAGLYYCELADAASWAAASALLDSCLRQTA